MLQPSLSGTDLKTQHFLKSWLLDLRSCDEQISTSACVCVCHFDPTRDLTIEVWKSEESPSGLERACVFV